MPAKSTDLAEWKSKKRFLMSSVTNPIMPAFLFDAVMGDAECLWHTQHRVGTREEAFRRLLELEEEHANVEWEPRMWFNAFILHVAHNCGNEQEVRRRSFRLATEFVSQLSPDYRV